MAEQEQIIELAPVKKTRKLFIILFVAIGVLVAASVAFLVMYLLKPAADAEVPKEVSIAIENVPTFTRKEGETTQNVAAVGAEYTLYVNVETTGGATSSIVWRVSDATAVQKIAEGRVDDASSSGAITSADTARYYYTFVPIKATSTPVVITAMSSATLQEQKFEFVVESSVVKSIEFASSLKVGTGTLACEGASATLPYYTDQNYNKSTYVLDVTQRGEYDELTQTYLDITSTTVTIDGVEYKSDDLYFEVGNSGASAVINAALNGKSLSISPLRTGTAVIKVISNYYTEGTEDDITKEFTVNVKSSSEFGYVESIRYTEEVVTADFDAQKAKFSNVVYFIRDDNSYDLTKHLVLDPFSLQFDADGKALTTWSSNLRIVVEDTSLLKVTRTGTEWRFTAQNKLGETKITITDSTAGSIGASLELRVVVRAGIRTQSLQYKIGSNAYQNYSADKPIDVASGQTVDFNLIYAISITSSTSMIVGEEDFKFSSATATSDLSDVLKYISTTVQFVSGQDGLFSGALASGDRIRIGSTQELTDDDLAFAISGTALTGAFRFSLTISENAQQGAAVMTFNKIGTANSNTTYYNADPIVTTPINFQVTPTALGFGFAPATEIDRIEESLRMAGAQTNHNSCEIDGTVLTIKMNNRTGSLDSLFRITDFFRCTTAGANIRYTVSTESTTTGVTLTNANTGSLTLSVTEADPRVFWTYTVRAQNNLGEYLPEVYTVKLYLFDEVTRMTLTSTANADEKYSYTAPWSKDLSQDGQKVERRLRQTAATYSAYTLDILHNAQELTKEGKEYKLNIAGNLVTLFELEGSTLSLKADLYDLALTHGIDADEFTFRYGLSDQDSAFSDDITASRRYTFTRLADDIKMYSSYTGANEKQELATDASGKYIVTYNIATTNNVIYAVAQIRVGNSEVKDASLNTNYRLEKASCVATVNGTLIPSVTPSESTMNMFTVAVTNDTNSASTAQLTFSFSSAPGLSRTVDITINNDASPVEKIEFFSETTRTTPLNNFVLGVYNNGADIVTADSQKVYYKVTYKVAEAGTTYTYFDTITVKLPTGITMNGQKTYTISNATTPSTNNFILEGEMTFDLDAATAIPASGNIVFAPGISSATSLPYEVVSGVKSVDSSVTNFDGITTALPNKSANIALSTKYSNTTSFSSTTYTINYNLAAYDELFTKLYVNKSNVSIETNSVDTCFNVDVSGFIGNDKIIVTYNSLPSAGAHSFTVVITDSEQNGATFTFTYTVTVSYDIYVLATDKDSFSFTTGGTADPTEQSVALSLNGATTQPIRSEGDVTVYLAKRTALGTAVTESGITVTATYSDGTIISGAVLKIEKTVATNSDYAIVFLVNGKTTGNAGFFKAMNIDIVNNATSLRIVGTDNANYVDRSIKLKSTADTFSGGALFEVFNKSSGNKVNGTITYSLHSNRDDSNPLNTDIATVGGDGTVTFKNTLMLLEGKIYLKATYKGSTDGNTYYAIVGISYEVLPTSIELTTNTSLTNNSGYKLSLPKASSYNLANFITVKNASFNSVTFTNYVVTATNATVNEAEITTSVNGGIITVTACDKDNVNTSVNVTIALEVEGNSYSKTTYEKTIDVATLAVNGGDKTQAFTQDFVLTTCAPNVSVSSVTLGDYNSTIFSSVTASRIDGTTVRIAATLNANALVDANYNTKFIFPATVTLTSSDTNVKKGGALYSEQFELQLTVTPTFTLDSPTLDMYTHENGVYTKITETTFESTDNVTDIYRIGVTVPESVTYGTIKLACSNSNIWGIANAEQNVPTTGGAITYFTLTRKSYGSAAFTVSYSVFGKTLQTTLTKVVVNATGLGSSLSKDGAPIESGTSDVAITYTTTPPTVRYTIDCSSLGIDDMTAYKTGVTMYAFANDGTMLQGGAVTVDSANKKLCYVDFTVTKPCTVAFSASVNYDGRIVTTKNTITAGFVATVPTFSFVSPTPATLKALKDGTLKVNCNNITGTTFSVEYAIIAGNANATVTNNNDTTATIKALNVKNDTTVTVRATVTVTNGAYKDTAYYVDKSISITGVAAPTVENTGGSTKNVNLIAQSGTATEVNISDEFTVSAASGDDSNPTEGGTWKYEIVSATVNNSAYSINGSTVKITLNEHTAGGGSIHVKATFTTAMNNKYNPSASASCDLVISWSAQTYIVQFNSNDGNNSSNTQNITYGIPEALTPNTFTRTGHTFGGWSTLQSGTVVYQNEATVLNLSTAETYYLYAVWIPIQYTVSFNSNGGSSVNSQSVAYGTKASAPQAPTRVGYTFKHWTLNGSQYNFNTTIEGGITLVAVWEINKYTVTIENGALTINGYAVTLTAAESGKQEWDYNATYTANFTAKISNKTSGYDWEALKNNVVISANGIRLEFENTGHSSTETSGWSPVYTHTYTATVSFKVTDNTEISIGGGSTSVIVTFYDGDLPVATTTVLSGSTVIPPQVTLKDGYKYVGWCTDALLEQPFEFDTKVAGELKLYLKQEPIKYTVMFLANNGAQDYARQEFTYDAAKNLTANAFTRTGYAFAGWSYDLYVIAYEDNEGVSNLSEEDGDTVILYAMWTANTYSVRFNGNGNSGGSMTSQDFTYDTAQNLTANTYARTGYTFAGWATSASGAVVYANKQSVINLATNGEVILHAAWTANTYTVSFNGNGGVGAGMANQIFTHGVSKSISANTFTREGYTFAGWTDIQGGTSVVYRVGQNVSFTKDTTLYAVWTAHTYSVQFNGNGNTSGSMTNQPFTYDAAQNLSNNKFVRTGYTFAGWATTADGAVAYTNQMSVSNLTTTDRGTVNLYAVWTVNQYYVAFFKDSNDIEATSTQQFTYNVEQKLKKNTMTKDGYVFAGWDTDSAATNVVYADEAAVNMLSSEHGGTVSLYAVWKNDTYTVTCPETVSNATILNIDSTTVVYNGSFRFVVVPNENYSVTVTIASGTATLSNSGTLYTLSGVQSAVTIKVEVTYNGYTVTFNYNYGNITEKVSVASGATVTEPSEPTRTGYTFGGWYTNANLDEQFKFAFTTLIAADTELFAKWTANTYNVTFNANGGEGSMSAQQFTYGTAQNLTDNINFITRDGYTFAGWATSASGAVAYANNASVTNPETTLYAVWTANTYKVTFNANGGDGESMGTKQFTYDVAATLIPNSYTRDGHTFAGWATSGNNNIVAYVDGQLVMNLATTGEVILYAVWTANTYTVTFNGNGGVGAGMPNQIFTHGVSNTISANTFTREGYTFAGWTDEQGGTLAVYSNEANVSFTNDTDLYAVWTANTYNVSFNGNGNTGGSAMSEQSFTYGTPQTLTANTFTRDGYTFAGWATTADGAVKYTNQMSVSNLTTTNRGSVELFAVWTAVTHAVTFSPYTVNNATILHIDSPTVAHDGSFRFVVTPDSLYTVTVKANDQVLTPNGNLYTVSNITEDVEIEISVTYNGCKVTFNNNYGAPPSTTIETIEKGTALVKPTDPTREGFTFDGWYTDANGNNKYDFGTPVTSDIELFAKWTANTYTVQFYKDSSDNSPVLQEFVYGVEQNLTKNQLTKEGFDFIGWDTDSAATTVVYADEATVSNLTSTPSGVVSLYAVWTAKVTT